MDTHTLVGQNEIFSKMLGSNPLKSYKKVVLGKILVRLWDSLTNTPKEEVFSGDPRKGDETVIDVWSDHERVYFERMNRSHFESGALVEFSRPAVDAPVERTFEQFTDAELAEIVNSRFLALQATLNKISSVAVLFRIKNIAEDNEKSEKIAKAIEARIAEVQAGEYTSSKPQE